MRKPYLKKLEKIGPLTVWWVDGAYVRKNINSEFTNFGQHYRFPFIPKNEFWLDQESAPGEENFFIDHLLVEYKLMARGKSYEAAFERADQIEKRERHKSKLMQRLRQKKYQHQEFIKKIHKKLWWVDKLSGLKVWLVNGELVRSDLLTYFTEGGHDLVYAFIPKKEVWLDDDIKASERKFIFIHELRERNLMAQGWGYDKNTFFNKSHQRGKEVKSAHISARSIEYFCRHHPKQLAKKLTQELKKAQQIAK